MNYKIAFKLFLIIFLSFTSFLKAQDFEVQVVVNVDALSIDAKDRVSTFKQNVEDYYNRNRFYENSYFNETNMPGAEMYKIKAVIQFNFKGASSDNYDVQMLVASQRIIDKYDKKQNPKYTTLFKNLDERCSFTYTKSMQFIKNDLRFDPLLSLLDYYAYMMLGYDQDSFFPKDDSKNKSIYFQKAVDICNKPMSDRNGWTETGGGSKPSRLQLVQELLNPRYEDFRNGFFEYHWFGLDSLGFSKNAHTIILNALKKIGNIKKKEVKAFNIDLFFDAKNAEIADVFLNYGDKRVYDQLILIDPSHQRVYEEAKKRAK
ncbi:MAG: DUF4835 family protein [Ignavibacteriae bacterium]|nr:DUF4835 family protein [Ignavibacteriota bacterium]